MQPPSVLLLAGLSQCTAAVAITAVLAAMKTVTPRASGVCDCHSYGRSSIDFSVPEAG